MSTPRQNSQLKASLPRIPLRQDAQGLVSNDAFDANNSYYKNGNAASMVPVSTLRPHTSGAFRRNGVPHTLAPLNARNSTEKTVIETHHNNLIPLTASGATKRSALEAALNGDSIACPNEVKCVVSPVPSLVELLDLPQLKVVESPTVAPKRIAWNEPDIVLHEKQAQTRNTILESALTSRTVHNTDCQTDMTSTPDDIHASKCLDNAVKDVVTDDKSACAANVGKKEIREDLHPVSGLDNIVPVEVVIEDKNEFAGINCSDTAVQAMVTENTSAQPLTREPLVQAQQQPVEEEAPQIMAHVLHDAAFKEFMIQSFCLESGLSTTESGLLMHFDHAAT